VCFGRREESAVLELEGLELLPESLVFCAQFGSLHLLTFKQPQKLSVLIRKDFDLLVLVGILKLDLQSYQMDTRQASTEKRHDTPSIIDLS
jgi:hypothetical protein